MKIVKIDDKNEVHFEHGIVTGVFQEILGKPARYLAGSPTFNIYASEARAILENKPKKPRIGRWVKHAGGDARLLQEPSLTLSIAVVK